MESLAKEKNITLILLVIICVIIAVLVFINFYYFANHTTTPATTVISKDTTAELKKAEEEFNQIKQKLLDNTKFKQLKKYGVWPLKSEDIKKGSTNPFAGSSGREISEQSELNKVQIANDNQGNPQ